MSRAGQLALAAMLTVMGASGAQARGMQIDTTWTGLLLVVLALVVIVTGFAIRLADGKRRLNLLRKAEVRPEQLTEEEWVELERLRRRRRR
ncbi:MAG TPA: hypothetical protein VH858_11435 [Hyphomicrobiales bacterium]